MSNKEKFLKLVTEKDSSIMDDIRKFRKIRDNKRKQLIKTI